MEQNLLNEYYDLVNKSIKDKDVDIEKLNRMKEIQTILRKPNTTYYFLDCPIHGITEVIENYKLFWWDGKLNIYHFITKTKNENYYKYFTNSNCELPDNYQPSVFKKLVHFKDSEKLGMIVHSKFCKIEQDQRKFKNN